MGILDLFENFNLGILQKPALPDCGEMGYFMAFQIRVLHVLSSLEHGGVQAWLRQLMKLHRPEMQFDFLVCRVADMQAEIESLGGNVYVLPKKSPKFLRHLPDFRKRLSETRYDVLHAHTTNFSGLLLKIAKEQGVPVRISHSHNTGLSQANNIILRSLQSSHFQLVERKRIVKYATHLLACSENAGRLQFAGHWQSVKPSKTMYCGIQLDQYRITEPVEDVKKRLLEKYGIPKDAIIVGTIGRLIHQKNYPFLLVLLRELIKRDKRYVLFGAGEGPLRNELESQATKMGLRENVFFPGICHEVHHLVSCLFDVFCLASHFEGFGIVLVEAMAGGLHCVCSDVVCSDLKENTPDRLTLLNLQAPVSKWADAVEEGIQRRLSPDEGYERIRQTPFSIEQSYESLLKIYRQSEIAS